MIFKGFNACRYGSSMHPSLSSSYVTAMASGPKLLAGFKMSHSLKSPYTNFLVCCDSMINWTLFNKSSFLSVAAVQGLSAELTAAAAAVKLQAWWRRMHLAIKHVAALRVADAVPNPFEELKTNTLAVLSTGVMNGEVL